MIGPYNRNPEEYVACIVHAMRSDTVAPHPRGDAERVALQDQFPEIAEFFADCGVRN